jgi:hypothetical protein
MSFVSKAVIAACVAASAGAASAATVSSNFVVTYEAPGVTNSTATFDYKGVETFDSRSVGASQNFTTNFGLTGGPVQITGQYKGIEITPQSVYGGSTGNYAVTYTPTGYELDLSAKTTAGAALPVTYFGFWLSALDLGNTVTFYSGATQLFTFDPAAVLGLTGNCPNGKYCGNPSTGGNQNQPYVFLNFFEQNGTGFDRILFTETAGGFGGYESDNHTVGRYQTISGTEIKQLPEPGSLALVALAITGAAVVRRRRGAARDAA